MSYKFNPFTKKLDYFQVSGSTNTNQFSIKKIKNGESFTIASGRQMIVQRMLTIETGGMLTIEDDGELVTLGA